jgi:hypothetical protein
MSKYHIFQNHFGYTIGSCNLSQDEVWCQTTDLKNEDFEKQKKQIFMMKYTVLSSVPTIYRALPYPTGAVN